MEDLFNTTLSLSTGSVNYHVVFHNETYIFKAQDQKAPVAEFVLKREHDEWHCQAPVPAGIKDAAVDALEKYLLQQH